jgi:hypothetical protein
VVPHNNLVVSLVVIVTIVVFTLLRAFNLLGALAYVVDLRVVENLLQLIRGQVISEILQGFGWRNGVLNVLQTVERFTRRLMDSMLQVRVAILPSRD